MKIAAINSILFRGNEPKVEAKPKAVTEVKPEVKAPASNNPQIKEQPKKDTVELTTKKTGTETPVSDKPQTNEKPKNDAAEATKKADVKCDGAVCKK